VIELGPFAHVYRDTDTGRIIPDSTTSLLRKLGFAEDSPYFNEPARRRGSFTHAAIHYHTEQDLDESTIDDAIRPYFMAAVRFLVDTGFVVTRSEFVAYSAEWDFASTVDFEGSFPGSIIPTIGDWKSGKMQDWTRYQLALEEIAMGKRVRRIGVELRRNGRYRVQPYTDKWDRQEVLTRLKAYKEGT